MATIAFDFDGVIHSYKSGWRGAQIISDPPVPGIREAIQEMRKAGYEIVIISTRCREYGGTEAITRWLDKNGIVVDDIRGDKIPAKVYIDDRAIRFDGHPENLLEQVQNFKTWMGK